LGSWSTSLPHRVGRQSWSVCLAELVGRVRHPPECRPRHPRASQNCVVRPGLASGEPESWSVGSPSRVSRWSWAPSGASLGMPSGKSEMRCSSGVGLGRAVAASPALGWPRASRDRLPPGVSLGRVVTLFSVDLGRAVTASTARDWTRASRECVFCPKLTSFSPSGNLVKVYGSCLGYLVPGYPTIFIPTTAIVETIYHDLH
jgi:hypothetical protein